MKIIEIEQNTPEWLSFRSDKIGASDAPIIMQDSPWCTPYKLWERKMGFDSEQTENFAMSEGKRLEPIARQQFEEHLKIPFPAVIGQNTAFPWMIASFDGFSIDGRAVEIKCVGKTDHATAVKGQVPEKYRYQLQHQLAVSGLGMIYYYSFDKNFSYQYGNSTGVILTVERNNKMIDEMMEKELKFLECMKTCTPPDLEENDYEIRNDQEWEYASRNWLTAQKNLQLALSVEKERRIQLLDVSKSKNSKGSGVKVQRVMRKGLVDYCSIPALNELDLDKYRKPSSETWRITSEVVV